MSDSLNENTTPPMPPKPPEAPKPPLKRIIAGAAAGAVLLVAATVGVTFLIMSDDDGDSSKAEPTPSSTSAEPVVEEETEEPDIDLYNEDPSPEDFEVDLKTMRRSCFNSYGCNVTVQPELGYNHILDLDPEATVSVTFEIKVPGQPAHIETVDLSTVGDSVKYSAPSILLSEVPSSAKLSAKITEVSTY